MTSTESFADGCAFSKTSSISGHKKSNSVVSTRQNDPNEMYYNMCGEKYLLVFNHHTFMKTIHFGNERPDDREDTKEDVKSLKRVFQKKNYIVLVYNDLVYNDIIKVIIDVSKRNHSKTACVCIAILTHGAGNDLLCAADKPYSLRDIIIKLENGSKSLTKKPKLFFIQACRGNKVDAGRIVAIDGAGSSKLNKTHTLDTFQSSSIPQGITFWNANSSFAIKVVYGRKRVTTITISQDIPTLNNKQVQRGDNLDAGKIDQIDGTGSSMVISSSPNFLVFRSSVAGYLSFRNRYGSILIQELCKAVENNNDEDIHYITTLVNKRIAYYYSTYTPNDEETNNKKQMTEVSYTLTKLFKF